MKNNMFNPIQPNIGHKNVDQYSLQVVSDHVKICLSTFDIMIDDIPTPVAPFTNMV